MKKVSYQYNTGLDDPLLSTCIVSGLVLAKKEWTAMKKELSKKEGFKVISEEII